MNTCFGYCFTAHKSSRFEHVALLYVGPGSIRKGPYVKERDWKVSSSTYLVSTTCWGADHTCLPARMIQLGPYNYEPTITAKWSYRTTVHVWRVRCGTYRSTSTNECDHNNRCTYFIIARSFARPPSLLLLLWSMIILCFEVMNTVPGTCLMRILVYVIHIVVRVRMRVKKGIKTTNACIQLPTTQ